MSKIYMFLANGFETVEALAVADILRRVKDEVVIVGVGDKREIESAQKITVTADVLVQKDDFNDGDVVFLPGGMPGTLNLENNPIVIETVKRQYESGKIVAAICAAPSILGHLNMLNGRKATCFPGFEKDLYGAEYTGEKVVVDANVVTSKGMGTAVALGLKLVELLHGREASEQLGRQIQY